VRMIDLLQLRPNGGNLAQKWGLLSLLHNRVLPARAKGSRTHVRSARSGGGRRGEKGRQYTRNPAASVIVARIGMVRDVAVFTAGFMHGALVELVPRLRWISCQGVWLGGCSPIRRCRPSRDIARRRCSSSRKKEVGRRACSGRCGCGRRSAPAPGRRRPRASGAAFRMDGRAGRARTAGRRRCRAAR
jgi:hypothetical protein